MVTPLKNSNDSGTYSSGYNYVIGIGLHQIQLDIYKFGIAIQYEKYGGEVRAYSGGLGGGRNTDAVVDKSLLSFTIFPFNRTIFNQLNISLGISFSALLRESFSGTRSIYIAADPSMSMTEILDDQINSFSSSAYVGLRAILSYDIKLSEKYFLSPQYSYNLGITNEFKDFPRSTKAMRHYLAIGLKRNM